MTQGVIEVRAWLVSLACDKAKDHGYPHELWTTRLLARHARGMRRLIFSLSCSSGKAANAPKPVSFVIASSQIIGLSRWCRRYAGEREQARILVEVLRRQN